MSATDFMSLAAAADGYRRWLEEAALPLWASAGVDAENGGFREGLTLAGVPHDPFRRARVQARQAFVYATLARTDPDGPWLAVAKRGFDFFRAKYRRADGLFANTADASGAVTDARPGLYEQDFALLALSALERAEPGGGYRDEARGALAALAAYRHGAGGFRELDAHPFQANAQMHLLECGLEWEEVDPDGPWTALVDEIVALALGRFVDPETGVLREYFDAEWRPIRGEAGLIEPGHHFEWAWLLERWGRLRGEASARDAARRLFANGVKGVDLDREVAVNALHEDLSIRDASARLWPQTEYMKAALILDEPEHALRACRGLAKYLEVPLRGVWRDKMRADGSFVDEPAPASSFYHILLAVLELSKAQA